MNSFFRFLTLNSWYSHLLADAQIIYNRNVANSDDVPAGPTVSNKPSRLKANNILESSWAILKVLVASETRTRKKRSLNEHKRERNRHVVVCLEVDGAVPFYEWRFDSCDPVYASFDPHALCCNLRRGTIGSRTPGPSRTC